MICKQCGNEIAPDAKFCGVCGAPAEAAEPQYAQPVEQPQYAQPVEQQYAQPVEQPQYAQPVEQQYAQPVEQPQYAQPVEQPQYMQSQYNPQYGQQYNQQYGQQYNQQYGQQQYASGAEDPYERDLSKSVLVFGILAIALCEFGVLGIIFGAIALKKANAYAASYPLTGRAKTGRILGLLGLIFGIISTVIWLLIIVGCSVALCAAGYSDYTPYSSYSSYYPYY